MMPLLNYRNAPLTWDVWLIFGRRQVRAENRPAAAASRLKPALEEACEVGMVEFLSNLKGGFALNA